MNEATLGSYYPSRQTSELFRYGSKHTRKGPNYSSRPALHHQAAPTAECAAVERNKRNSNVVSFSKYFPVFKRRDESQTADGGGGGGGGVLGFIQRSIFPLGERKAN